MRFTEVAILIALTTFASAVPVDKRWLPGSWWQSAASTNSLADFFKRHPWPGMPVASPLAQLAGTCDVSKAQLPAAPTPLPPPSAGLTLYHVALGRGTQNYTCDTTNSSAIPVAVGAVASLFNSTCMAANANAALNTVPAIALNLPCPASDSSSTSPLYADLSGHHYFIDTTTPYFNLDTDGADFGQGPFKKVNATAAPSSAPVGQNGQGYGAVAWLKLQSKGTDGCAFQEVYRVNTAGGNPPPTCQGMAAAFEVQYSAEYWMYSK